MISITGIVFILGVAMVTAAIKGWIDSPRKQTRMTRGSGSIINRSVL